MLMYNDLFVTPRQKELDKLKDFKAADFITNPVVQQARQDLVPVVRRRADHTIQIEDEGESFIQELRVARDAQGKKEKETDIIEVIMRKYNSSTRKPVDNKHKQPKKESLSVFSQQLEVLSPDSLYFTQVQAPFTPAQGWAPSLPAGSKNLTKTSV